MQRLLGMFAYYSKWIPNFSEEAYVLFKTTEFPLGEAELAAFERLKHLLKKASLQHIDESAPFTIECDASEHALGVTLNQNGKPVAFMTKMLSGSELHHSSVEKEASAVVEAVRKWSHLLQGRPFTIITD